MAKYLVYKLTEDGEYCDIRVKDMVEYMSDYLK